ncbi:MAG: SGNH/GDSL hydrolase family protein [Terriglobia bacterium]
MRLLRRVGILCAGALVFAAAGMAQGRFQLKEGDRVVFYGDSITDQRLYTVLAETYVVTRFPKLRVGFVHSGWGGDRVTGGGGGPIDLRLKRDVIAYKPTVMTIMLGMNDGGYRAWDDALFKTYSEGYGHIIDSVKKALPGIRVTVIQPSPYDDVTRPPDFAGGYNAVLIRYGQFVKELGERDGLTVADMNTPVVAMLEKANATDPELAKKIIPDRVHPEESGHLIMAEALLKAWNAPSLVAVVEIDAGTRRVVRAEKTQVTALHFNREISWTETDDALPAPLPHPLDEVGKDFALAVQSSDFVEALDQEPLKVTGLTAERYALKIDGEKVGDFTKEKLAEGVNLALEATPMSKQASRVHDLTVKHNDLHYARWREVQTPFQDLHVSGEQAALDALDKLEVETIQLQRATAQPKPRHYELAPE